MGLLKYLTLSSLLTASACSSPCDEFMDALWMREPVREQEVDHTIPEYCYTQDDQVVRELRINGSTTTYSGPRAYEEDLEKVLRFSLEEVGYGHPQAYRLKDIVFYDPLLEGCGDENLDVPPHGDEDRQLRGYSNGNSYLLFNDPHTFYEELNGDRLRSPFDDHVIAGVKYIFMHEMGHHILNKGLRAIHNVDFARYAPEDVCDRRHYLVDQLAIRHLVLYALENEEELKQNESAVETLTTLVKNDSGAENEAQSQIADWHTINRWNEDQLAQIEEYWNIQNEFFINVGAIDATYKETLDFGVVRPVIHAMIGLQQAYAKAAIEDAANCPNP